MIDQTNGTQQNQTTDSLQPQNTPLKEIEERIKAGVRWQKQGFYRDTESRWKQWEKNQKYLRCIWPDSDQTDVVVNTIYGNYLTKRPTLYFKNPRINAIPTKPEFTRDAMGNVLRDQNGFPKLADNYKSARLFSIKLNYELREIGYKNTLKKVIGDNLCPYGIGWKKWGYSTLTAASHSNQRDTTVSYWCKRVDPRNMVYDWLSSSIEDCKWIAERVIMTKQQALNYGFQIPDNYVCSLPDFLKDRNNKAQQSEDTRSLVIFWEYHDLELNQIRWFLIGDRDGGITQEIREPTEDPYPFEGSCYVPLVLNPDNDDLIGLSDVEPVEDQALALNRMRTMEVKYLDNFGPGIIRSEGSTTAEQMGKFNKTPFGWELVLKDGFTNQVQIVTPPSLGNDHARFGEVHKDEMRTTLGITEFQQGGLGGADTKATIGSIVQNSSNLRIEEQRDVIYDTVIEDVRRLAAMIQTFSSEEDYINLKEETIDDDYVEYLKKEQGFDPDIPFLRMSKKDIQGEYNFEFNIEDMIVRPKEVQLQQWIQLLQVIGSNPALMEAAVQDNDVSMGKVVKKVFDLAGADMNEVKRGGPQPLNPEQENQMFLAGMEVPEPHLKDDDDEHILSHKRAAQEVDAHLEQSKSQVMGIQQQMGAIQPILEQGAQQGMAPQAGAKAQGMMSQLQAQMDDIVQQTEPIQNISRRMKIHIQMHDQNRQEKEMKGLKQPMSPPMGGGPQGPMPGPQSGPQMQNQIQSQANQGA